MTDRYAIEEHRRLFHLERLAGAGSCRDGAERVARAGLAGTPLIASRRLPIPPGVESRPRTESEPPWPMPIVRYEDREPPTASDRSAPTRLGAPPPRPAPRPAPVTLIVSVLLLVGVVGGAGLSIATACARRPDRPAGGRAGRRREGTAAPPRPETPDPAAGLSIYKDDANADPAAPTFAPAARAAAWPREPPPPPAVVAKPLRRRRAAAPRPRHRPSRRPRSADAPPPSPPRPSRGRSVAAQARDEARAKSRSRRPPRPTPDGAAGQRRRRADRRLLVRGPRPTRLDTTPPARRPGRGRQGQARRTVEKDGDDPLPHLGHRLRHPRPTPRPSATS